MLGMPQILPLLPLPTEALFRQNGVMGYTKAQKEFWNVIWYAIISLYGGREITSFSTKT